MAAHGQNLVNDVITVKAHALDTLTSTVLGLVGIDCRTLDVAVSCNGNHDVFNRNQVSVINVASCFNDFRTSLIVILRLHLSQFILDYA